MTLSLEQLTVRRRAIGSTDSAAIIGLYHPDATGLSKYKNATDVWLRLVHDIELPPRKAMDRGIRVEPMLRALYRSTIGGVDEPYHKTMRHPQHDWMVGSPDGLSPFELVEFKTVTKWAAADWGEPGTDEIPPGYGIQVQHLMGVTDRETAHVLAAFGSDYVDESGAECFSVERTALYIIPRDNLLIGTIIECGRRFMSEYVETRKSPVAKPLHNIRKWQSILKQQQQPEACHGQ